MEIVRRILFTLLLSTFNVSLFKCDVSEEPTLTISTGQIKGKSVLFRGCEVHQFLGIPFAEPPLDELRFIKPVPKSSWSNILDVKEWKPHCMQTYLPGFNDGYSFDEDCLFLNVIVTQSTLAAVQNDTTKLRPVMVWIHGGGFLFGSANNAFYDGTALAVMNDVVFVSINYRLGAFGFLHLPESGIPGNMGLWDQLLALKWVQNNIHFFGGNPDQVTIFGESAGSMSVSAHILSPQSNGLFKNAIMQSGSLYNIPLWINPRTAEIALERVNCTSAIDKVSCLRSVQAENFNLIAEFYPVMGDEFLPSEPEKLIKSLDKNVNILLGVVGNEGVGLFRYLRFDERFFNPNNPVNLTYVQARNFVKQLFGEQREQFFTQEYLSHIDRYDHYGFGLAIGHVLGDISLTCPTYMFGHDAVKTGKANVYAYFQTQKPSKTPISLTPNNTWIPATHCDDLPMVFGLPFTDPSGYSKEDTLLSLMMMNAWGSFAKFGEPQFFGDSKRWRKWKLESGKSDKFVMELNTQRFGLSNNRLAVKCEKNWPFPMDSVNLNINFDEIINLNHDEL